MQHITNYLRDAEYYGRNANKDTHDIITRNEDAHRDNFPKIWKTMEKNKYGVVNMTIW